MLPYSEFWRWDIYHVEVCCVERYVDSQLMSFITWCRWKCWEVVLHASDRQRMWMGDYILMNLGTSSGQIIIISGNIAVGASIHTFGAIGVGMVALLVFPISSGHLFSIPALFFTYIAVIHDGGLASGWQGALILQNCLLAFWHVLNCCCEFSTAFLSS